MAPSVDRCYGRLRAQSGWFVGLLEFKYIRRNGSLESPKMVPNEASGIDGA